MRRVGIASLLLLPALQAHGQPGLTGRLTVTGLYYAETESPALLLASPAQLAFGDFRAQLTGQRLADRIDLRLDARVRAASNFDFEYKYRPEYFVAPPTNVSSRGYLGGPEYDLREAYLGAHLTPSVSLYLGRMYVPEADAIKVDAVRLKVAFGEHWKGSVFAGGYPNPYSRSLLSDYTPPCGNGVASGDLELNLKDLQQQNPLGLNFPLTADRVRVANEACSTGGAELALAGGITAAYQYSRIWGNAGLVGSFFNGAGDGGPVQLNGAETTRVGNLLPANTERDAPRIYVNWTNHITPVDRFDLFSDLVVDLFGSSGPQLTRANLLGSLRLLREDRLNLRASYSYMSSLAVNMFLNRLLYNRTPNGTTLGNLGIVENNLTVLRTGRHEARVTAELRPWKMLAVWAEGRLRHRSLLDSGDNPAVYEDARYTDNTRSLAGDATVGLRDGGSRPGLRGSLSYTLLRDYRALNHLARLSLGGTAWKDRLTIDGEYLLLVTTDDGADQTSCARNLTPPAGNDLASRLDPNVSLFAADCFGRRRGTSHEVGLTVTVNPWRMLFFLVDYRFSALLTDPQAGREVPMVLGHSLLGRAEVGF